MANPAKYYSAKDVAVRIARNNKNLSFELSDIIEWCAECEIYEIGEFEQFTPHYNQEITVKDGKALLPCNVYRVLNIAEGSCKTKERHTNDGVYLHFPDKGTGEWKISIDYLGIPLDEDGYPAIMDGHQEACYWYCLTKIMLEDYLNKKIDSNQWSYINSMSAIKCREARSTFRFMTRNQMDEHMRMMHNMTRKVGMPKNI